MAENTVLMATERARHLFRKGIKHAAALFMITLFVGLVGSCYGTTLKATVTSAPLSCTTGQTAAPRPVAGASVYMTCPNLFKTRTHSRLGMTNEQGILEHCESPFGRWLSDICDVVIKKEGFQTRSFRVPDVCTQFKGERCVMLVIVAELVPVPNADPCP